jgi:hypothetical protein
LSPAIENGWEVSRSLVAIHIESIAQQQDPLKRLRKNGGARDVLEKEGILILGAKYDRELLDQYGYGHLKDDEWVAVKKEG